MNTMDINRLLDQLELEVGRAADQLQCLTTAMAGFRNLAVQVMEYPEKHADFVKFVAENANFQLVDMNFTEKQSGNHDLE